MPRWILTIAGHPDLESVGRCLLPKVVNGDGLGQGPQKMPVTLPPH